jgi:starch-binding outer membrane protein, SusD/RagB family
MKNIKYLLGLLFIIIASMTSCDKTFLDKKPLDQIASDIFFHSSKNLELYMNQFYKLPLLDYGDRGSGNYSQMLFLLDLNSDNHISEGFDERLNGTRVVPASGGGWDYSDVRAINYFFENYKQCLDNFDSYKHYLGEAFYFRATIYYLLVQQFGDVLWYDKVLSTNSPELYDARTPRNVVVDHIISDLDSAAMYLDEDSRDGGNRLNRWTALALQSRVALYEGTWEKYQNGTVFGVQNANPQKYLNKAVLAADEIITSDKFAIYSMGKPDEDYFNLFDIHDYSGNSEVILWKKFDKALGIMNYRMILGEWPRGYGVTKGLVDAYLCSDGLPIKVSPLYQGNTTLDLESQDRDPRFKQSIFTQDAPYAFNGVTYANWNEGVFSKYYTDPTLSTPTGYHMRKGTTTDLSKQNYGGEDEPIILFDYAEVLLNYAEAKAELGTITQADINLSIKPLRDRVAMPNLVMASIVTDPDWEFPDLSPIINEIRRERRVELAFIGFRWNDIARWAAADELIIGKRPKGSAWGSTFAPLNTYPDDADGFMDPYQTSIPNGYGFELNRDYLNPLPQSELTLNDKLTQNPGWE